VVKKRLPFLVTGRSGCFPEWPYPPGDEEYSTWRQFNY